jgi:hypothetical protein
MDYADVEENYQEEIFNIFFNKLSVIDWRELDFDVIDEIRWHNQEVWNTAVEEVAQEVGVSND